LDWSAKEAADLLDITVPAVNSSLQRARARLRERLPSSKPAWPAGADPRGDSAWRALALDVLRIEDGVIAEIVTFPPDCFLPFGLPLIMDEASEVDPCH
jgi:hypothetical protein